MATDIDLLILGGGCAGLSLAWRLSELGKNCPSVLVLEQRTAYRNDRTWCFWDQHDARIDGLIEHQWRWLALSSPTKRVRFDGGRTAYQMLAASSFYARALQALRDCPSISLSLGQAVTSEPVLGASGWTLECGGKRVTARMVVDTRPQGVLGAGGAVLWQSFYGHEVHCAAPVFSPETAELMDFGVGVDVDVEGQIPFSYVLPISKHRALIESTVFGPTPLGPAALSAQLDSAVNRYTAGNAFSTLRSESGVLPMGLARKPPSLGAGHVVVGVMAGGARASSGFAFQRIQQWADQCCAAIASGGLPVGHRDDPLLVRMMDRLFLQVLLAAPHAAPHLFLSLFERADRACVIRFLSGTSTVWDCLRVIKSLPAKPFVRQLFSGAPAAVPSRARS
jgi:lycopene beta-cyclase